MEAVLRPATPPPPCGGARRRRCAPAAPRRWVQAGDPQLPGYLGLRAGGRGTVVPRRRRAARWLRTAVASDPSSAPDDRARRHPSASRRDRVCRTDLPDGAALGVAHLVSIGPRRRRVPVAGHLVLRALGAERDGVHGRPAGRRLCRNQVAWNRRRARGRQGPCHLVSRHRARARRSNDHPVIWHVRGRGDGRHRLLAWRPHADPSPSGCLRRCRRHGRDRPLCRRAPDVGGHVRSREQWRVGLVRPGRALCRLPPLRSSCPGRRALRDDRSGHSLRRRLLQLGAGLAWAKGLRRPSLQ